MQNNDINRIIPETNEAAQNKQQQKMRMKICTEIQITLFQFKVKTISIVYIKAFHFQSKLFIPGIRISFF